MASDEQLAERYQLTGVACFSLLFRQPTVRISKVLLSCLGRQGWHWSAYCLSTVVTFDDASVWTICASVWVAVSPSPQIPLRSFKWIRLDCVFLCPGKNVLCVHTDNYCWWWEKKKSLFLNNRLVRRQLSFCLRGVSWNIWAALKQ